VSVALEKQISDALAVMDGVAAHKQAIMQEYL
jgi:hypothetical protein